MNFILYNLYYLFRVLHYYIYSSRRWTSLVCIIFRRWTLLVSYRTYFLLLWYIISVLCCRYYMKELVYISSCGHIEWTDNLYVSMKYIVYSLTTYIHFIIVMSSRDLWRGVKPASHLHPTSLLRSGKCSQGRGHCRSIKTHKSLDMSSRDLWHWVKSRKSTPINKPLAQR